MAEQITADSRPKGAHPELLHEPGMFTAIMVGLGAILGTGVFVSIGIGVHAAGPAVLLAIGVAALLAVCNGLAGVQMAAAGSPTAAANSGAYTYGAKHLNAHLGFTAGWLFLWAKSGLAAAAALGIAGYLLSAFGISNEFWRIGLALIAVLVVVGMALRAGAPRARFSHAINIATAIVALLALIVYIAGGLPIALAQGTNPLDPFFLPASSGTSPLRSVLHASALMFVAYTGYGRIATLGNEIRDPARTIPRAVVVTLVITLLLYLAVAIISIANAGALEFAELTLVTSAPLEVISATFTLPGAKVIVATGAIAAMLGILFNLMLGLARVMLAMGRRKEMPVPVARVSRTTHTPETAIIAVGVMVSLLVLIGDIATIWSFSSFTALIYYAITNLGVLQLPPEKNRLPRFIPAFGLLASSFLAFWVEPGIWIMGLFIIAFGHAWRWLMRRL